MHNAVDFYSGEMVKERTMRNNHRVGSMRVNVVCADLQSKGFEVFREDGLCSFDIVAHKDKKLLRIEIKGMSRLPKKGPVGCTSSGCELDARNFDVLAGVKELPNSGGFSIRYSHSIFHTHNLASYELTGPDIYSDKTTRKNLSRATQKIQEGK